MSYARFSTDRHHSDIYAYQSTYGDFVISVAKNRHRKWWQLLHRLTDRNLMPTRAQPLYVSRKIVRWLGNHLPRAWIRYHIHSKWAGATLRYSSEEHMYRALYELANDGIVVPGYLLEETDEKRA